MKRRVGIVGFGAVGQHLVKEIQKSDDLELDFIWNRTSSKLESLPKNLVLKDLAHVVDRKVDIIVEVADPIITAAYASLFLSKADYLVGSPTALADEKTLHLVKGSALSNNKTVYIPSGAFWGAEDVMKMADNGKLKGLTITMQKHPSAFRLQTPLKEINESFDGVSKVLYEGPVKYLCELAPNNVNTMSVACIAGHNLGFDNVVGRLISDKRLSSWHIVEAELKGDNGFCVQVTRKNPTLSGAVSGLATYDSFWSSLKSLQVLMQRTSGAKNC